MRTERRTQTRKPTAITRARLNKRNAHQDLLQHFSGIYSMSVGNDRQRRAVQGEGRWESAATQQPWKQQEWGGTERRREQQRRQQQQQLSGIFGGLCSRIPDPSRCLHFMTVLADARPAALLAPTSNAMDVAGKLPTVSASCREFTKEPTTSGEPLHTLHVAF